MCLRAQAQLPQHDALQESRLDMDKVESIFAFTRRDKRFGGRCAVATSGGCVWVYASGKIVTLAREILEAMRMCTIVATALKERGLIENIYNARLWNTLTKIEPLSIKRISLRQVRSSIAGSRLEPTQRRVVMVPLHRRGVNEVSAQGLIQVYGTGKILIRSRLILRLEKSVVGLIPAKEGSW